MMSIWPIKVCRRRPKSTLIVVACLSFTALIALNQRSQHFLSQPNRNRLGSLETADTPVESKHALYQSFEDEVKVPQYNTRDIFTSLQNGTQPKAPSRTIPLPSKDRLEVFVVPFTHVDPGWLRTFESYSEETDKILNNVYEFLPKNKKMRFIWAEFVFFEKWWAKQSDEVKKVMRGLVRNGNFELASGSWVMTDEANAYFPVSVDNIVEGHQFLQKEFGKLPSTVWSNDPFGYSHSVPYLFARAGLKRTVINRIHHPMKHYLQSQKAIPFNWRQLFDKDGSNEVLTHVLPYTHYDIPNSCGPDSGTCCMFDFRRMTQWGCGGRNPENITASNVKDKASLLVGNLKRMAEMYESNVLIMMHGDDFRYELMSEWHQQHDNFIPLFDEINKGNEVKIRFGTFNDYFTAMEKWYKDHKKQPAKLTGDFFPYACALGTYWTGYFTTRPFYKRQGRLLHAGIHAADTLLTTRWISLDSTERDQHAETLTKARRTLLLFQHHDAITGTSKKSVMKDYSELLFKALQSVNELIQKLEGGDLIEKPLAFDQIPEQTILSVAPGKPLSIAVFNQLPYQRPEVITLRVNSADVVATQNGEILPAQIEPCVDREGVRSDAFTLAVKLFLAPLGKSTFSLSSRDDILKRGTMGTVTAKIEIPDKTFGLIVDSLPKIFKEEAAPVKIQDFGIDSERISTRHDEDGSLLKVKSPAANDWIAISQKFAAYTESRGGAYIMNVRMDASKKFEYHAKKVLAVKGPVRQVLHAISDDVVPQQSLAVNNLLGSSGEQLHWKVLVDVRKKRNFELVTRFETQMNPNTTFMYTDSVGLQLVRRDPFLRGEVSSNYYPMPTAAVLDDRSIRLTVASNVEHGAMQHKINGMEIMLDRVLNQDDGKGLGSDVDGIPDDMKPTAMDFSFLIEQIAESKRNEHLGYNSLAGHLTLLHTLYPPISLSSPSEIISKPVPRLILPCEYQLVSLRKVSSSGRHLLVIFRAGIDPTPASMVNCITSGLKASLRGFLTEIGAKSVLRTNLGGVVAIEKEAAVDAVNLDVNVMDFLVLSFII